MKKLFKSVLVALGTLPVAFLANDVMGASTSNEVAKRSTTTKQVQKNNVSTNASNAAQKTDFSVELLQQSRGIVQFQQGKNSGGQADVLVPFYGNNHEFLFTDILAYQWGSQYQTLSGGLGGRALKADAVYGLYGFYDFQTSNNKFTYHRYNIGAERFDGVWELRTNLYYYADAGIENITDLGQTGAFIQGNDIKYNHYYDVEQSYNLGGDFEVGRTLGLEALRGYVAYYNYGNEIYGGRVRASYDFGERWQVIGSGQYDAARGWLAYGGVNYWIGKAKTNTGTALDHIRDPIVRDMTIGVKKINSYNAVDTDTRNIYFASPTGSATGTGAENDPLTLDAALSQSSAGDFIYLSNGSYTLDSVISLKASQILWGTGADLTIKSALNNTYLLKPAVAGTSPVLDASAATLKNEELCQLLSGSGCAIYVTNTSYYGGFTVDGQHVQKNRQGFLVGGSAVIKPTISNVTAQNFSYAEGAVLSAGIRVNNPGATVMLNDVNLNNNGRGLRVFHGTANVYGVSKFINNSEYGIQVGGTSVLGPGDDAVVNVYSGSLIYGNLVYGAASAYGGRITLNGVAVYNNTTGVYSETNGKINISGSTSVYDNTNEGLLAYDLGATITVDSGALIYNNGTQAQSQGGGTISINDPTTLIGDIYADTGGVVIVNYLNNLDQAASVTVQNLESSTCTIQSGKGFCTIPS